MTKRRCWLRLANNEEESLARGVKIADLEENMDIRRPREVSEKDKARLEKYLKAWRKLQTP